MKWLSVAALVAASVSLVAQSAVTPPPAPAPQAPKESPRVEQRAQSMRDQIGSGRHIDSHVRVSVRLKNGNKLSGVVKDGKLVERVDGLRFVEAQAQERGAGVRLWYSSGARNYVFVPFADFAEYEVLQRLSNKQIADIEGEMQMEERRAAERAAALAERAKAQASGSALPSDESPAPGQEPAAGGAGKPAPAGGDPAKPAPETEAQAQQRKWFALVNTYSPDDGWNKARRDEIARRLVVVGSKPNELEQAFVDQFAEWEKACKHFAIGADKPAGAGGQPANDGAEGNGSKSSKRRK
ncbi:MAG: hypothetical protein MUC36_21580 [Planctomycetes bacterium]|jgi:hypothetical protein|nr:hypothetical protein [Planctomycetota bacterium]